LAFCNYGVGDGGVRVELRQSAERRVLGDLERDRRERDRFGVERDVCVRVRDRGWNDRYVERCGNERQCTDWRIRRGGWNGWNGIQRRILFRRNFLRCIRLRRVLLRHG
jgi:hypothetical protein